MIGGQWRRGSLPWPLGGAQRGTSEGSVFLSCKAPAFCCLRSAPLFMERAPPFPSGSPAPCSPSGEGGWVLNGPSQSAIPTSLTTAPPPCPGLRATIRHFPGEGSPDPAFPGKGCGRASAWHLSGKDQGSSSLRGTLLRAAARRDQEKSVQRGPPIHAHLLLAREVFADVIS